MLTNKKDTEKFENLTELKYLLPTSLRVHRIIFSFYRNLFEENKNQNQQTNNFVTNKNSKILSKQYNTLTQKIK